MDKFLNFLESIKTPSNKTMLEAFSAAATVLLENPDTLYLPGSVNSVGWENSDALPFIYLPKTDSMLLDKDVLSGMHIDLVNKVIKEHPAYSTKTDKEIINELGIPFEGGRVIGINGRLWLRHKLISFWEYPSEDEFKNKIIPALKAKGVNVDSSWKVEAYPEGKKPGAVDSVLVPVDEYVGKFIPDKKKQEELDKMREWHTLSPIEKEKLKKSNPNKETPVNKVDTGDKTMAEYNYLRKELAGD